MSESALFANNLFCYNKQYKPWSDAFHAALMLYAVCMLKIVVQLTNPF